MRFPSVFNAPAIWRDARYQSMRNFPEHATWEYRNLRPPASARRLHALCSRMLCRLHSVHVYQKRDGRLLGVSEKCADAAYRAPDCIALSIHGILPFEVLKPLAQNARKKASVIIHAVPVKAPIKTPARHLARRAVSKIRVGGDTSLPRLRAGCFFPLSYFRSLAIVRAASTPL